MNTADVIFFMGQSNMAGRGDFSLAPPVPFGIGYEYRAVSSPGMLHPLTEPFGADENLPGGVFEPGMKTGSMVAAFVNACYENTHIPIVGVSCAKGGSSILEWRRDSPFDKDAYGRFEDTLRYLEGENISVRSVSMAWCQGCTDGDNGMEEESYAQDTGELFHMWRKRGVGQIFLIQTGNHRDCPDLYLPIRRAQKRLAETMDGVIMVSEQFASFAGRGLMKDCCHYRQEGYNLVGAEAGANAGVYLHERYAIQYSASRRKYTVI